MKDSDGGSIDDSQLRTQPSNASPAQADSKVCSVPRFNSPAEFFLRQDEEDRLNDRLRSINLQLRSHKCSAPIEPAMCKRFSADAYFLAVSIVA